MHPVRVGLSRADEAISLKLMRRSQSELLRWKTTQKSARFSRGVMFQPLSRPLQPGIRFLCDPIPAPLTVSLTVHLPKGSDTGLPRSLSVTRLG